LSKNWKPIRLNKSLKLQNEQLGLIKGDDIWKGKSTEDKEIKFGFYVTILKLRNFAQYWTEMYNTYVEWGVVNKGTEELNGFARLRFDDGMDVCEGLFLQNK
jgi:hypothetical protein